MTDALLGSGSYRTGKWRPISRRGVIAFCARTSSLVLALFLLCAVDDRPLAAHETIDADRVNQILAAADQAAANVKTAAGLGTEGETRFALGLVLVDATETLNRDLAAHSGRLTFNAEHLLKSLAQRDLAPRFDEAIGRYRLPRTPLEEALRLSPAAPFAVRARFLLLKAGFYESFVLDPFQLVGIGFDDLAREIAEAETVSAALKNTEDAEEAAFIHAIDLARAARLAPQTEAARSYADRARMALNAFAEAYPESMRAAAAGMILKGLGGAK